MILSQTDLADHLGVTPASVSQATSRGHRCKGQPVQEWAIHDKSGRVSGYRVPDAALDEVMGLETDSAHPGGERDNGAQSSDQMSSGPLATLAQLPDPGTSYAWNKQLALAAEPLTYAPVDASHRTSLFPEGQSYFGAATAVAGGQTASAAISEDNRTSRAVVTIGATLAGAYMGMEVAPKRKEAGAAVGALLGLGTALMGFSIEDNQSALPSQTKQRTLKSSGQKMLTEGTARSTTVGQRTM
jgi:hypothetical protein